MHRHIKRRDIGLKDKKENNRYRKKIKWKFLKTNRLLIVTSSIVLVMIAIVCLFRLQKKVVFQMQKKQLVATAKTAATGLQTYILEHEKHMECFFSDFTVNGMVGDERFEDVIYDLMQEFEICHRNAFDKVSYFCIEEADKAGLLKLDQLFRANKDYYNTLEAAIITGRAYTTYWYDKATKTYDTYILKAVKYKREYKGFVLGKVNLNYIYNKILAPLRYGRQETCIVTDLSGRVIIHNPEYKYKVDTLKEQLKLYPEMNEKEQFKLFRLQQSGVPGTKILTSYPWSDESNVLVKTMVAYAPLMMNNLNWVLTVSMPLDDVIAVLETLFFYWFVLIVLVLWLFGVFVYYVTKQKKEYDQLELMLKYETLLSAAKKQLRKQEKSISRYNRLQTLGLLSGTIAHEFNNLITPIHIYAELLKSRLGTVSITDSLIFEDIDGILNCVNQCQQATNQLLTYSKNVKGNQSVAAVYDFTDVLHREVKLIELITPRNIRFETKIDRKSAIFEGNTVSLHQVVLNLCKNSIDAMKDRGGILSLIYQVEEGTCFRIVIKDNGSGISKENQRKMFEPFFTTKANKGTGLGLTMVKNVVKEFRGDITVETKEGEGTRIEVTIPMKKKGIGTVNYRVLTDEELYQKNLNFLLVMKKIPLVYHTKKKKLDVWECEWQEHQTLAYQRILEQKEVFQVVIVEQDFDTMTGFDFCSIVKRQNSSIKTMLAVDAFDEHLEKQKKETSVDAFIVRPITKEKLLEALKHIYRTNLNEN